MKKFLLRFTKSKWSKVLACTLICTVFLSLFAISSSAVLEYDTVSFSFNFSGGRATITAFHQQIGGNLELYDDGITYINTLNLNNYSSFLDIWYDGQSFFDIYVVSYFSSISINGVSYLGSTSYNPNDLYVSYSSDLSYSFSGDVLSGDVPYFYHFYISAFNYDDYNEYYLQGFQDGINSNEAKNKWYPEGYNAGYAKGEQDGLNSSESTALGQNLIGDTLSAPLRALNQFQLFTAPNGTVVTLGMVFGGMLGLMLLLAFLKMFAGG